MQTYISWSWSQQHQKAAWRVHEDPPRPTEGSHTGTTIYCKMPFDD